MIQKISIVTGVAGLIGSRLADKLMHEGHVVIGLDSLISGDPLQINALELTSKSLVISTSGKQSRNFFHFIEGRVQDSWAKIDILLLDLKKVYSAQGIQLLPSYVFHMASIASPSRFITQYRDIMEAASLGVSHATDFCRRENARLILASTSEVYGLSDALPLNESNPGVVHCVGQRSSYNEAKRFAEAWVTNTNRFEKSAHGIIRIFNTYGPGQNIFDTRVIPSLIRSALVNQDIQIFGDGTRTRSFCFVDDLVNGIFTYANSNISEPMNLGNDTEISMIELAHLIIDLTNSKSKIVFKPSIKDEVAKRIPDLNFARSQLGYVPKTDLIEGLRKTIEDFRGRIPDLAIKPNPAFREESIQSL